ncbi:fructose-2,6-bisphosphatase [Xenococcus sp. PCC 7305]|uniref:histidine phosphatase family protein n=1 Tax=Xenococcus sp. PCC 7305 TaxID=102125 RepID=UPI0002ACA225|nr:histidine phosphatase family protein [Xenococcus sp. PCC 7305]ELS04039.1 fructose-2,6-bisphosphatase [Xenococcus sp. PCC 7305]
MKQTVWIARHGNRLDFVKPEWFNTAKRRYDPPLSEDGFIQAQELGQRLKNQNISHIISSPFLRTIQTANEVAQVLDLPIKLEAGLSEWMNPDWMDSHPEIHPQEFLAQEYPRIDWGYKSLISPNYPETQARLTRRTQQAAGRLISQFPEDILLVGHGASVLGVTRGLVKGNPSFRVPLCSITKIVCFAGEGEITLQTDTSHLSQTETTVRLN